MLKNRLLTVLLCIFTVVLVLTFSIGLPIYVRPFYYMQIDSLKVTQVSGFDKQTIKDAYDSVLDYLTLPNREFSAGVFEYSEEGKSHFEDCKLLFNLNISLFLVSFLGILVLNILKYKNFFTPSKPFGKHYAVTCGGGLVFLIALLACAVAINFEKAFLVFHNVFFFGKDNWVFNRVTDPIIKILPMDFFFSCAVLIVCSIITISFLLIAYGYLKSKIK